jgi:DNA polymerase V
VEPTNGCIVVALLDGEFTVKRYIRRAAGIVLHAENPSFADIEVSEERSFEIWGVVVKSIRML